MIKPNGLPKSERLSSMTAVRTLFAEGASGFVFPLRYMFLSKKSTSPSVEVLFSVPKRYHKRANKRNLLRRRTKEAYRLNKGELISIVNEKGLELDIALIYSTKDLLPYKNIENALRRILADVTSRC